MASDVNNKGQDSMPNETPPKFTPINKDFINTANPYVKGKRKFTCEVCREKFANRLELESHLQNFHGYSPELMRLEREEKRTRKQNRRMIDTDSLIRSAKKHSLRLTPFIIIIGLVVIYFIFYASSNVGISYTELTYGSIFSKVGSLLSSGAGGIYTFITVDLMNPNLALTQPQVTSTNSTPTFSSFLTFSYPSNQKVALTTNPQQGLVFYSVYNSGNVPLGPDTSNNLLVNISCGNTFSSGATQYCKDLLTSFTSPAQKSSSPPEITNSVLIGNLAPGETKENATTFNLSCPTSKLTFPLSMSLLANFLITNYTAAVILPVEFMSSSFQNQLIASSQAFIPSEPSFNFYSAGPVQIKVYTEVSQPIPTKINSLPLGVTISNHGSYPYSINNISLYISKSFYPSNPSNSYWSCVSAKAMIRLGFQFPGSGYWDCYINSASTLNSGNVFYFDLKPVESLNGMHFNTMTVVGYVNYNYDENLNMPVVVSNQVCSG